MGVSLFVLSCADTHSLLLLLRLYYAEKPFTKAILKSLRFSMEYEMELRRRDQQRQLHKAIAALANEFFPK